MDRFMLSARLYLLENKMFRLSKYLVNHSIDNTYMI